MILLLTLILPIFAKDVQTISRIAFGSCYGINEAENPEIWDFIGAKNPELFIWLGDIIYADLYLFYGIVFEPNDFKVWRQKYIDRKNEPRYADFKAKVPIIGIWDDHDFGLDNSGKDFEFKKESQKLFLEFVEEPKDSIRWQQEGIYTSYQYKDLNIILLDNRYFNNQLDDVLGDTQWDWLEAELQRDTRITILASGIQFDTKQMWDEGWDVKSYARLRELIRDKPNVLMLSGDLHYAEMMEVCSEKYVAYEVLSSGLTHTFSDELPTITGFLYQMMSPRYHHISPRFFEINFGFVEFNWQTEQISLILYSGDGTQLFRYDYAFDQMAQQSEWCEKTAKEKFQIVLFGGWL